MLQCRRQMKSETVRRGDRELANELVAFKGLGRGAKCVTLRKAASALAENRRSNRPQSLWERGEDFGSAVVRRSWQSMRRNARNNITNAIGLSARVFVTWYVEVRLEDGSKRAERWI